VLLKLPEEAVRGLKFLQTLDLRETHIQQLPQAIFKLGRLMCLCVGRILRTVPEGIGELVWLECLRLQHISSDSVHLVTELSKLRRLRFLEIGIEEFERRMERALVESLPHLHGIRRLEVYCQSSARAVMWEEAGSWMLLAELRQLVIGGIWFSRLPYVRLYKLSHMHVGVEVVKDRDMETIGMLPSLRSLMLVTLRDEQSCSVTAVDGGGDVAFAMLKFFTTNVRIKFGCQHGSPMPSLEDLELRIGVRAAKDADYSWFGSIANLPSLQKVMAALECHGASAADVEEADAAVRRAVGVLGQNRPTLEVITRLELDEVLPLLLDHHMALLLCSCSINFS
jgi:hypothetical protein